MAFDYSKLKGRIVEKFSSQYAFAEKMGMSERTLSLKLNGLVAWKQTEICKAVSALELNKEDISEYFFKEKVQKIEQVNIEGE